MFFQSFIFRKRGKKYIHRKKISNTQNYDNILKEPNTKTK